jgi:beta-glucosidase
MCVTMGTMFEDAAARVAAGADHAVEARAIVAAMTVEERLGCLDGDTPFWPGLFDMTSGGYYSHTWPAARVERLGVPGIEFADGPRGCVVGAATCFPVSMARGATFNPELEEQIGSVIGAELRASGATYTGAVCMNLLRHPAWGRAQETYGEDPHHVGEMAASLTRGLQTSVMACMKHFAVNSMENARFTVDVTADERALHEVYLPHFKRVANEGVASVMSAYNSLNGEWCGENETLLIDILRREWGWDGFVTSDFIFGLRDAVKSVGAGLNIEMPFRQQREPVLADALADGSLRQADVDQRVVEIVATLLRFWPMLATPAPPISIVASPAHVALARSAAEQSMVLVRNDNLLPLDAAMGGRIAVIGRLAAIPNLGDGGSSNVHPPSVITPLDGLRAAFASATIEHSDDDPSIAAEAEVAVVVVGYTLDDEGEYIDNAGTEALMFMFPPPDHPTLGNEATLPEFTRHEFTATDAGRMAAGGDRSSLRLSAADEALIAEVVAVNPRTIVAVMSGSAVVMPWAQSVAAVVMTWYPGMEGGHALGGILSGEVNPSGRLPFAIPTDEAHLVHFDRDATAETYDLLHGQWYLDEQGNAAAFPFGFGLSYTSFELGEATWDGSAVSVKVTNTGSRSGATVVQLFCGVDDSAFSRPRRRLTGFRRVELAAGESQGVTITVDEAAIAIRSNGSWLIEDAPLRLEVGFNAASCTLVC